MLILVLEILSSLYRECVATQVVLSKICTTSEQHSMRHLLFIGSGTSAQMLLCGRDPLAHSSLQLQKDMMVGVAGQTAHGTRAHARETCTHTHTLFFKERH